MQIRELSQPVTSKKLNESIAKKFGYQLKLEQFTNEQLEDARNKLRTKISQFELSESFDSVLESTEYQKTRMFLDCINQEILERDERIEEGEDKCECEELGQKECPVHSDDEPGKHYYKQTKPSQTKKETKTESKSYTAFIHNRGTKLSVPESWINDAISRIELGESDRDELKSELKLRYDLSESQASWMLLEGEEDKAEIIMATKDMVDRITGWLEDVAAMKAEQLLELVDSIGKQQGSDVAQQYNNAVKPALEAVYTALETSRAGLAGALGIVSGEGAPTMGAPAIGGELGGADLGAPAGGEMPTMGGEEELPPEPSEAPLGSGVSREKRESVDYSRRLGMLLNSKKK
jgi:hypothetical protein